MRSRRSGTTSAQAGNVVGTARVTEYDTEAEY
jgi:hypothetical protein